MKKMKKALACLLATLMLLTALPLTGLTAFAAGETTITLNQPASVTVPGDGNYAYAYFTPPTDGVYKIYSTGDEIDPYCHLYNGDYEILSDDDSGEERNFSFYVFLNAGIKYCLKIDSFNEYPGDITVYVTESDIVSVTFRNLTIIYDYDYEYCSDWYGDDWYDYKRQNYEDCIGFTVTKKDGTSLTEEDTYVDITVTDNQGYNNEWKPGNTYTATVTGFGVTATIKVTVVENPIQSVTVTKQPIIEKMEGSWETDNYYDEELGEYVSSPEYWYYDWEARRPDKIDLHLKDGTIYTLDEDNDYTFCWNGSKYNLSLWSDQSYEDRWDVGKHIS